MSDQRQETGMTIREVSEATGLSAHTLRYYERIGLMMIPVQRARGGHRLYTPVAVEWVNVLRHLRMTGMPIADMKHFATLVREGPDTAPARLALLQDHREAIIRHISSLQASLAVVNAKIETYSTGNATTPASNEPATGNPTDRKAIAAWQPPAFHQPSGAFVI